MRTAGICLVAIVLGTLGLAGCSRESADWKAASAADSAAAYQQFLQQHPKSANAAQAQARIAQIADDRDWQAAAAADTRDAYGHYVAQHADGKWAQEARIRIENFAQSGTASGSTSTVTVASPPPASASMAAKPASGRAAANAAAKPAAAGGSSKVASVSERGHFVQLGAFHSKARAESEWKKLSSKYPTELQSLKPHYVAGKSKSGPVYKLRVGMSSASDARGLCATLKKHFQVCVPVTAAGRSASGLGQRLT
jgi:cell division septation protein DedD